MMNPPSLNFHEACPDVAAAQAAIRLDRMQTEFRRGRPVIMETADPAAPVVMLAVETLNAARLRALVQLGGMARLLLTAERLRSIGWSQASGARSLLLGPPITVERVQRLAAVLPGAATTVETADLIGVQTVGPALEGALTLTKRSRVAGFRAQRHGAAGSAAGGSAPNLRHGLDRIGPVGTRRGIGPDPRQ